MGDFYEQFLTEDFEGKRKAIGVMENVILVLSFLAFMYFGLTSAMIIIVLYLGIVVSKHYLFVEYEYALTNNELDIFRITNKSRRKLVTTIDIRRVDNVKKLTSSSETVKGKKCYVGENKELTTLVIEQNEKGQKVNYGLRFDETLLANCRRINPGSFKVYNN